MSVSLEHFNKQNAENLNTALLFGNLTVNNKNVQPVLINPANVETLTKTLGLADAPLFIAELKALDIGDDIKIHININGIDSHISIPKNSVKELSSFQAKLSKLSKVGRDFKISIEGDRILISVKAGSGPKDGSIAGRWSTDGAGSCFVFK